MIAKDKLIVVTIMYVIYYGRHSTLYLDKYVEVSEIHISKKGAGKAGNQGLLGVYSSMLRLLLSLFT